MQQVSAEVWATLERRLEEARVPAPQRPDCRKWVRFYLDFCHKYSHRAASPTSLDPFLAKLASKNQCVAQRNQASAAVGLLLRAGPEPGATRPSLRVAPAPSPCAPLNSQPAVLLGAGTFLPRQLEKKYKNAAKELVRQWFFPAPTLTFIPKLREQRRYHLHESHVQGAVKQAAARAAIPKRVSLAALMAVAHTPGRVFANPLFLPEPEN